MRHHSKSRARITCGVSAVAVIPALIVAQPAAANSMLQGLPAR